jgi:hypothetical protein
MTSVSPVIQAASSGGEERDGRRGLTASFEARISPTTLSSNWRWACASVISSSGRNS